MYVCTPPIDVSPNDKHSDPFEANIKYYMFKLKQKQKTKKNHIMYVIDFIFLLLLFLYSRVHTIKAWNNY